MTDSARSWLGPQSATSAALMPSSSALDSRIEFWYTVSTMAKTGPKKVKWVARLFDPIKGHTVITTFATDTERQAWEQQKAIAEPDLLVVFASVPDPWDDSRHWKILEQVRATGKPKVYITRP